ncbi:MAG: hypothetical protein JKY48_01625 [Flavobacteriales bacterium]|nr:hypothetical protein [Flavobacteriales bacterium]
METKRKISTLLLLISFNFLSAQVFKSHEFSGQILIGDKKAKEVTIKVFNRNACSSTYRTTRNAKFIFIAGIEEYYTLSFEKEGYVTKRVVIDTKYTRKIKETEPFKFDIILEKEIEGVNYAEHDFPVAIIKIDKKTKEFGYSKEYSKDRKRRINLINQMAKR